MKKTVAILLIAVLTLSFVACSAKSKIVGTWVMTDETGDLNWDFVFEEYRFKKDGTFLADGEVPGAYRIRGNDLILRIKYGDYEMEEETYRLTFQGDTMTWTNATGSMTFTKK